MRRIAWVLTGATALLATLVPMALLSATQYDAGIAMSCLTAIGAIWATVGALESLQSQASSRVAEVSPLMTLTVSADSYGVFSTTVRNAGKGAAVELSIRCFALDADGLWSAAGRRHSTSLLAAQADRTLQLVHRSELPAACDAIAVRLRYRSAVALSAAEEVFHVGVRLVDDVFPLLGREAIDLKPKDTRISAMLREINQSPAFARSNLTATATQHTGQISVSRAYGDDRFAARTADWNFARTTEELRGQLTELAESLLLRDA